MCLDVNLHLFILLGLLEPVGWFLLVLEIFSYNIFQFHQYASPSSPFETPVKLCYTSLHPSRGLPSILYFLLILVHIALSLQVPCHLSRWSGHFVRKIAYRNNLRLRIASSIFRGSLLFRVVDLECSGLQSVLDTFGMIPFEFTMENRGQCARISALGEFLTLTIFPSATSICHTSVPLSCPPQLVLCVAGTDGNRPGFHLDLRPVTHTLCN